MPSGRHLATSQSAGQNRFGGENSNSRAAFPKMKIDKPSSWPISLQLGESVESTKITRHEAGIEKHRSPRSTIFRECGGSAADPYASTAPKALIMKLRTLALLAFAIAVCPFKSTQAEMIASESFEYPSRTSLVGASGSGTGFSTNWTAGGRNATISSFRVQNGSLSYSGLQSLGNSVVGVFSNSDIYGAHRQTTQNFVGASNGQTTWMSFLIRQDALGGTINGFGGIYIGNSTNEFDPKLFIGKGGDASNTWLLENLGGGGQVRSNTSVVTSQSTLLVVKMETLQGLDRFTLFVNPDGSSEPQSGFVKSDLDLGTANRITMYHTGAFSFDEIRIGTTFSDVFTAVPEPGSGLLVLTVASLAYWRRSRRTR